MKKLAWIILTFLMTGVGTGVMNAQDDKYGPNKAECLKYLSYYSEYYKQKNYADALPNWRKAYAACPPTANQNMLIQGISLLKSTVLPKTKDAAQRQAVIDSIMTLYDQRIATYPKYAESANNNKGLDLINFYKGDNQRLYDGLNAIIDAVGSNAKPSILMQDLNAAIELYKDGKLDAEAVIKTYQDNIALLETEIAESAEDETASETLGKVKADMEGLFITSKVASCENLIALFTPRYEANPTDIDLVSNIVRMMSTTDDCTDNDLFLKAATSMHRLQPSAREGSAAIAFCI